MTKIINIILIIIAILLLIVPSAIYIKKTHNYNLRLVVEKEVIEAANKCKNQDICLEDKVSLKFLIDNNYLEKVYDPITKEIISYESYVDFNNNKFVIV